MSDAPAVYDVTAARAAIDAEKSARARQCLEQVQAILQGNHCELIATPTILPDGRLSAMAQIVALDR